MKPTPLSAWENSAEHIHIGEVFNRHRKALMKSCKDESTYTSADGKIKYVTFTQAKKALD